MEHPPDSGRAWLSHPVRVVCAVLVMAASLVTVAACDQGPAPSPAVPTPLDRAGYATELRKFYDRFRWPSDYRPDLDRLIEATRPAADERLPAGVTRAVLNVVNSCAWYLSWDAATARRDDAASGSALRVMTEDLTNYPPPKDQEGRDFVIRVAERAKAGDPAPARQYVRANCDTTRWAGH